MQRLFRLVILFLWVAATPAFADPEKPQTSPFRAALLKLRNDVAAPPMERSRRAREMADAALARGDREDAASALMLAGNLAYQGGDAKAALDLHGKAIDFCRLVKSRLCLARALANSSGARVELGDNVTSLIEGREAAALFEASGQPEQAATVRFNGTLALAALGDHEAALRELVAIEPTYLRSDALQDDLLLFTKAEYLMALRRPGEALKAAEAAIAWQKRVGDGGGRELSPKEAFANEAIRRKAHALAALGRGAEAERLLAEALADTRKRRSRFEEFLAEVDYTRSLLELRRPAEAVPHAERALAIKDVANAARQAELFQLLRDAYAGAGRTGDALAAANRALALEVDQRRATDSTALAEAHARLAVAEGGIANAQLRREREEAELLSRRMRDLALGGIAVALILAVSALLLWRARRREAAATAIAERAVRQRDALIDELAHRVRNNLQNLSNFIHFERVQLDEMPPGPARARVEGLLRRFEARIGTIASVHQRVESASGQADVRLDVLLRDIVGEVVDASDDAVAVDYDLNPITVDSRIGTSMALIACELVTNAVKHAFAGLDDPRIGVALRQAGDGSLELAVSDNGRGNPDNERAGGLGSGIVQRLAEVVSGTLSNGPVSPDGTRTGFQSRLVVPMAAAV